MSENLCLGEDVCQERGSHKGLWEIKQNFQGFFPFISVIPQNFLID